MSAPDSKAYEPAESIKTQQLHTPETEPAQDQVASSIDDRDDFGLPRSPLPRRPPPPDDPRSSDEEEDKFHDAEDGKTDSTREKNNLKSLPGKQNEVSPRPSHDSSTVSPSRPSQDITTSSSTSPSSIPVHPESTKQEKDHKINSVPSRELHEFPTEADSTSHNLPIDDRPKSPVSKEGNEAEIATGPKGPRKKVQSQIVSEWSHQRLVPQKEESEEEDEGEWQTMEAVADYDLYDDDGKLIAKAVDEEDAEEAAYGGLGGAGKGYTRVLADEDAQSATSMDDDTRYLFKETQKNHLLEEEDQRDAMSQLEATKDLLTEGQRIAYVGVTRLAIYKMIMEIERVPPTRNTKKDFSKSLESIKKWGQQMMVRLYGHMDIDSAEQIMIEQLAEHGVQPADLVPPLMMNARVANPMADQKSPRPSASAAAGKPNDSITDKAFRRSSSRSSLHSNYGEAPNDENVPQVQTPSQMTHDANIELDLRWTVLCDLFLVLIADSAYDSRSRRLLENVAEAMEVSWVQICRFEKRVIDALEMQEERDKENWNEDEHLENRRKKGLKRKYMVMGLATVGGGLVIGLSAGLLAPVIGAGLAAGFTTIGVGGTAGFLGGVGGAALITSAATAAGGTIAVRASNRRTGHVKTFEYRPLHNNKRLNLILTVSGWMSGKVDDVRLPYSTVDPIMGDIYSLLWEPEMLQSMGETINILATEALTQTVQQVLGSTILVALMASLQLPIVLTKLSYFIDNPWSVSLDRANSAGLILADSLIDRHLGNRPVTLVGFSLGSRLIFSCLKELASRGAYGIVQNVYLFGSPIVANKDDYLKARTVVSGRFVNGYASNDWILGYLFRMTGGGIMRVAGLAPVEYVPGVENFDVTALVNGHMAYRAAMPKLLREVGWEVESDEFTEIEDPDPENHAKRQRELIQEIEQARKDAEAKPEKKRFGFFKRGKLPEKKTWETYEHDASGPESEYSASSTEPKVLFDVDAIKRELESEMIEIKQLESTLPPMKLDLSGNANDSNPRDGLRQTKSSDATLQSQVPPPIPPPDTLPIRPSGSSSVSPRRSFTQNTYELQYSKHSSSEAVERSREASLSFEPQGYHTPPRELQSTLPPLTLHSSPGNSKTSFSGPSSTTPPQEISTAGNATALGAASLRPELRSSTTMPSNYGSSVGAGSTAPINLSHNAWVDEGDEYDLGAGHRKGDGEISMTFE